MNLNDLLRLEKIDPQQVIVLRHRPKEPELNKVLPWLAAERPELFNAYQQTQGTKLEKAMQKITGTGFVASFIGRESGKALFVGLYSIMASELIAYDKFWQIQNYIELEKFGLGWQVQGTNLPPILQFDLKLTQFYADWKGKLIVNWPPPGRSWWRWADRNEIPVAAILEDSALDAAMPEWDEMEFSWNELAIIPKPWKSALSYWPSIYYIFDISDRKGYVGSAYGKSNLLGRWQDYAADGHGGNKLLKERDRQNFRFSILQRISPGLDVREVIQLENSWKKRLHTRAPLGLNDN